MAAPSASRCCPAHFSVAWAAAPAAVVPVPPRFGKPPVARVEPVSETLFGTTVVDPYRWMENPKDAQWEPYVRAQAAYARRVIDAIPGRTALARRIAALSGAAEVGNAMQVAGELVFVEKRPAGASDFRLYVRRGLDGADKLLVDPAQRRRGKTHYSMNYWLASPDGRHVMYGLSASGSEQAVIEIMETATGRILPERIDRAQYPSPSWLPDGSGFFFNRLAEGRQPGAEDFYKDSVCWLHRLGTDPKNDLRVLSRGQFPGVELRDIDFPIVVCDPGSRHAVAVLVGGVQRELPLFTHSLDGAMRGADGWKRACTLEDRVTGLALRGDDLWMLTEKDAPRGRVLLARAAEPAFAGAREVVSQGPTLIRAIVPARDGIYLQELDAGIGRLRRLPVGADGPGTPVPVALPFDGAIETVVTATDRDGALLRIESWVRPAQVLDVRADGRAGATRLLAAPRIDVSAYESIETFATAKDGVRIPVSVVYRKGVKRDGTAPLLIQAYGAYAINSDPFFGPRYIAWMERGGVWATAHVRGGGEYGREWHEAGRLLTKPNTWRDLIASVEMLIAEGWTSASRVTINGGSAGGITVGMALTERPDLFGCVISQVGVSNALRAEFSQNGPPNIPEFGSVTTEDGFKGLAAMDAYTHVRDGTRYPAVMLTTGMTDPRVDPWNAAKMTARLQAANASDRPVLMRVDFDAGHGIGSSRSQRDAEVADMFAFALWQSGVAGYQIR